MNKFVLFVLVAISVYGTVETCKSTTPIHCQWNDWVIGECSATCGTGTRTNTRTKCVVEKDGGTCSGPTTETEYCKIKECPVHCEWDDWQIGSCSETCGGGTRTNTREEKVSAEHGGNECEGVSYLEESCNVDECPVDCEWDEWMSGECSKTCGGGMQPEFRIKTQEALFGGNVCEGPANREIECNTDNCPEPCVWDEWQLGECSVTCAGGTRIDTRTKQSEAKYGGTCDPMGHERVVDCNTDICPPIHCVWDEWVIGECSATCGTGTRMNARIKFIEEANLGTCTGQDTETEECKLMECPVHCEWDDWQIGKCSEPCGGGTRNNTREKKVSAAHGGDECDGLPSIEESCNIDECPVDCTWSVWTFGECSVACGEGVLTKTRTQFEAQYGGLPCVGESSIEEACPIVGCPLEVCPEEKSSSCSIYAYWVPSYCEDKEANDWFLGEDGQYSCKKSCGIPPC